MPKSLPIRLIKPNISQTEIDAVNDVLKSGMLVSGPVVDRFEEMIADYLDVSHAVCVSSGTAALHLSLLVADVGRGDEVIVPAFTSPATANAVEMVGARPVFVDCEPKGVNMDISKLNELVSAKTRAILPVHAFGLPVIFDEINILAGKHNLIVIEDAACALGSKYHSSYCGTLGDIGAFSFHPRKLLTTGEGGAIVTNDPETAGLLRSLRNQGWHDGEFRYQGYNYKMTDIQAALGIVQIEKFEANISRRFKLAGYYWEQLSHFDWLRPIMPETGLKWNVQTLLVKIDDNIERDKLITHFSDYGIETAIGTYCVPITHYYQDKYGFKIEDFPCAYNMFRQSLSLPLHNNMTSADIDRVIECLENFASQKDMIPV